MAPEGRVLLGGLYLQSIGLATPRLSILDTEP